MNFLILISLLNAYVLAGVNVFVTIEIIIDF